MERKFAWKHLFRTKAFNLKNQISFPFQPKERIQTYLRIIQFKEFVSAVKSDLLGSDFIKIHPNLTELEDEALKELIALQKLGKIVIQPADKGSGICIFDRTDYEAERQLNDTLVDENGQNHNFYQKVNEKTIKDQYKLIKDTLEDGGIWSEEQLHN